MSPSCATTGGTVDTPKKLISRTVRQLPGEILCMIGGACVEPFSVAVEEKNFGTYFDVMGFLQVKDIALASSQLNAGVKKGLRLRFSEHLKWTCRIDFGRRSLSGIIPLQWLIAQISAMDMHLIVDPLRMPYAIYSLFPNLRTVSLHTCILCKYEPLGTGLMSGYYDQIVVSKSTQLRHDFIGGQQQAGNLWLPDRGGRKLYVIWVFYNAGPRAVRIIVDITKVPPIIIDRKIVPDP